MKRIIRSSTDPVDYRVYEIDEEDGDELNCIKVFKDKDKAIQWASDYTLPTHVVMVDWESGDTEVIWPEE